MSTGEATPTTLRADPVTVELATPDGTGREEHRLVFDANTMVDLEARFDGLDGWQQLLGGGERADLDVVSQMLGIAKEAVEKTHSDEAGQALRDVSQACAALFDELVTLRTRVGTVQPKPFTAVRDTMAIALGLDARDCGKRMLPDQMQEYGKAVGAAFAIANGVDPTDALQMASEIDTGLPGQLTAPSSSTDAAATGNDEATKASTTAIPGAPGTAPGHAPDGTSTSSGG